MTMLSALTTLWSVAAVAFLGLMVYRNTLANRETDQLFLNDEDTVSSNHQENDRVVRRLTILSPICKGVGGATLVLTFAMAGVWLTQFLTVPSA